MRRHLSFRRMARGNRIRRMVPFGTGDPVASLIEDGRTTGEPGDRTADRRRLFDVDGVPADDAIRAAADPASDGTSGPAAENALGPATGGTPGPGAGTGS
jgi:hypothetical protein